MSQKTNMNSEFTKDQSIALPPVSIDELIQQTTRDSIPVFTSEQEQAMTRLDQEAAQSHRVMLAVVDTIGVVAGIKPGALIRESDEIMLFAYQFGLAHYKIPDKNVMTISRSEDLARALAGAFNDSWTDFDDIEAYQKIGRMLGYPETSTEYFIRRAPTVDRSIHEQLPIIEPIELENTVRQHFHNLILSPDHWQEELASYVIPLEAAVCEYAPLTYQQLERQTEETCVAAALGQLVGRQYGEGVAVTYVK